jgi:hypothetical protein
MFRVSCVVTIFLPLLINCGAPDLDPSRYSTACGNDDECVIVVMENVCSGCATAAISTADEARHATDLEVAQASCLFGIGDCIRGFAATCLEGQCISQSLRR